MNELSKLKTILIDDEKDSLKVLELELNRHCPDVEIVASCNSPLEGLKAIKSYSPDLIFLDINMPEITGLELIELIPEGAYDVVFTTAYEDYAIKAFKTSAVDYILKPVSKNDLLNAVKNVKKRKEQKIDIQLEFLSEQIQAIKNKSLTKLRVPTIDGVSFVKLDHILYCNSCENYCNIHLQDGNKIFATKSLKFLEEVLCEFDFERIHKSYIINLHKISSYSKNDGGYVTMEDGQKINISRSKKESFLNFIKNV